MTLQSIFEQNKERLISAVSGAEPVSAVRAMNAELDRVLYTFNDQEENAGVREAADSMIQVAKAACMLVDSAGETKVFGRTEYGKSAPAKEQVSKRGLLLLALGLIGAAVTAAGTLLIASAAAKGSAGWQSAGLPPRWVLLGVPLLTAAAFFLAGMLLRRGKGTPKETLHTETTVDAGLVYSRLLSVMLVIDKRLEEVRDTARREEKARLKKQAAAADPAELELLSRLLEDAYGRRGEDELADEEIGQIKFYLHRKNIDVVDWPVTASGQSGSEGGGTMSGGEWFDMIPAFSGGTIRPALVADGVLLKKGMASAGRG